MSPGLDLPALFRSASAFVLPSLAEGSALVTYMAMASALPVIVTEDAGSVATDGREGWIVPSRDVEALKAKILHLYEHRAQGAEMGAAGRKLIEDRYTWRHYHRRIAALHRAMHDGSDITRAVVEAARRTPVFAQRGVASPRIWTESGEHLWCRHPPDPEYQTLVEEPADRGADGRA